VSGKAWELALIEVVDADTTVKAVPPSVTEETPVELIPNRLAPAMFNVLLG
jgi:hypothetical protein